MKGVPFDISICAFGVTSISPRPIRPLTCSVIEICPAWHRPFDEWSPVPSQPATAGGDESTGFRSGTDLPATGNRHSAGARQGGDES